jgi:hypothetical protein
MLKSEQQLEAEMRALLPKAEIMNRRRPRSSAKVNADELPERLHRTSADWRDRR